MTRFSRPTLPRFTQRLTPWAIHALARFTRPLTMGVRAVILDPHDAVFLVRHTYLPGWHCPGGAIEPGETALGALIRETREEARIGVLGEPTLHGLFLNRRRDHVVVYVVRDYERLAGGAPDWEIAEGRFFAVDDLPEGTTAGTRQRLREILDGVPLSETW